LPALKRALTRSFLGGLLVGVCLGLVTPTNAFSAPAKKHAKKIIDFKTEESESGIEGFQPGVVITKISISGNKKIEADAIRAKLKSRVGEPINVDDVRADVQNIFEMGYFYNIEVSEDKVPTGVELTYKVTEKPSIVEIVYKGNDKIDKDDLQEAAGVKQYTILDQNKLQEAVGKMSKLYEDKGFFLARVQYQVETIKALDEKGGEEVKVIFNIKENDKVRVKKITFLGNHAILDSKLKSAIQTQEGGFFSFISSSGSYKQEVFDRDLQILNFLYFNEGYVQVKIDRPEVYVTPDKRSVYITIRIEEGEQFSVGKVDFAGDLLFSKDELFEATQIQKSGIFVYETLQKDLKALQFKYGDLGYAFANIIPRTQLREKERLVDIVFEIEKGQKVYFGNFTVTGNTKTRDKVVRRELRIQEGELYNETRRRRSEENIKRLGYFSDVVFNTSTPPDSPTTMNVDIQVKERSTGTIQVGAGYSTNGGFLFQGQISQTNLFGKGQSLAFSINVNGLGSTYNLGFTEPYFNDTQWSVGGDIYQTSRILTQFQEKKKGFDIRVGHPIAEYWAGYLTYKLEETEIYDNAYADPTLFDPPLASGIGSSVAGSIVYDKRNDRWAPTDGLYGSASIEQSGLSGEKLYTKGLLNFRLYKEIFWKLVFRNNVNYGIIGTSPDRVPPFNELFLLGGANSMRGFSWFTVGKRKLAQFGQGIGGFDGTPVPLVTPTTVPFGGTQEFFDQAEIEFNLVPEAQIKGVIFWDIGDADDTDIFVNLREDAGFGFRWFSPIGPLRFEWGFPLDRRPEYNENFSNFEFSIGSPF
jgi:outer membrane protein insertion porin family